jgi:hypothetical protein
MAIFHSKLHYLQEGITINFLNHQIFDALCIYKIRPHAWNVCSTPGPFRQSNFGGDSLQPEHVFAQFDWQKILIWWMFSAPLNDSKCVCTHTCTQHVSLRITITQPITASQLTTTQTINETQKS